MTEKRRFSITVDMGWYLAVEEYAENRHRTVQSVLLEATDEYMRRKEADSQRAAKRRKGGGVSFAEGGVDNPATA